MGRPKKQQEEQNTFLSEFEEETSIDTTDEFEDYEDSLADHEIEEINQEPKTDTPPRIFKLVDKSRKGRALIDGQDDIYDPETKKIRRARLLRGAESIWQDEQKNFLPEYVNKNKYSLWFENGIISLYDYQPMDIKFAELCNSNMGNPNRKGHKKVYFREWSPAKIAEKAMQKEALSFEAMKIAMTADYDEIKPHAAYLGIRFTDNYGLDLPEKGVRIQYTRIAKNDPRRFLDSLNNPTTKLTYRIQKAISSGIIDLSKTPGYAHWNDGGFIVGIPQGENAASFLSHFAQLPGQPNAAFKNQLETLIK